MGDHAPLIVIEGLLVLGAAVAFYLWQMRDLRRERDKREAARRASAGNRAAAEPNAEAPAHPGRAAVSEPKAPPAAPDCDATLRS